MTAHRLTLSIRDLRAVLPDVVMHIPAGRTEAEAMVLALEHAPRRTP